MNVDLKNGYRCRVATLVVVLCAALALPAWGQVPTVATEHRVRDEGGVKLPSVAAEVASSVLSESKRRVAAIEATENDRFLRLTAAPAPSDVTQVGTPGSNTAHSVWRDVLIGMAVGTVTGLVIGKIRDNWHNAECPVWNCNRVFEMETLAPLGAATGVVAGLVWHRRHRGDARSSSLSLSHSYSSTRRAIVMRAAF